MLDQVEMRVERLRRDTIRIEEEKDSLLSTLDSVKHSELLGDITECKFLSLLAYITFHYHLSLWCSSFNLANHAC